MLKIVESLFVCIRVASSYYDLLPIQNTHPNQKSKQMYNINGTKNESIAKMKLYVCEVIAKGGFFSLKMTNDL